MKIEILAKRVAQKTKSPILEKLILGEVGRDDLPENCMIWTGASTGRSGPRMRYKRGYDNIPELTIIMDRPRPVVNFSGKRHSVNRLLFDFATKLDYPYRLESSCGEAMCVNPVHYLPKAIRPGGFAAQETCDMELSQVQDGPAFVEDPWTLQEVGEFVETALEEHSPTSWQSLIELTFLGEVPHVLIDEYLKKIGKDHLCLPATTK
ncbi:hypothetical protein [Neptunicoccus cionae]|uniref:Uncharacterized protein n=1 Tax=Neptunicoccus cionae TaxID=2035344 RepID=A0A916R2X6_9RHOB|nr:hypothetical protein [Amylibacter cionae]GGA29941.1 hypothetical protein GCM10011498_33840 [Amylibacter cionae]